jgi:hypothetical protein
MHAALGPVPAHSDTFGKSASSKRDRRDRRDRRGPTNPRWDVDAYAWTPSNIAQSIRNKY